MSEKLKHDAARLGLFTSNMVVVGNGLARAQLHSHTTPWNGLGSTRPFRIACACNLVALKGTDDTLRAISILVKQGHKIEYAIAGDGVEYGRLATLARQLGIEKQVDFRGRLSHDETLKLISQADVFCMPSWSEGFGVVYVEAMGQGVPVIAVEGQGIDPIVRESGAGLLVPPHSPEQIAAALSSLLNDGGKWLEMSNKGYKYVLEKFTWEAIAEKLVEVYEAAINGGHE